MNGLVGPSDLDLAKRLQKRLNFENFDKRFYRGGTEKVSFLGDEDVSVSSTPKQAAPHNGSPNE